MATAPAVFTTVVGNTVLVGRNLQYSSVLNREESRAEYLQLTQTSARRRLWSSSHLSHLQYINDDLVRTTIFISF